MSDTPNDDLLVVIARPRQRRYHRRGNGCALTTMTGLGWALENSTKTWQQESTSARSAVPDMQRSERG